MKNLYAKGPQMKYVVGKMSNTKKKYLHHFHQPPVNFVEVSNNHLYQPLGKWAYPANTLTHAHISEESGLVG